MKLRVSVLQQCMGALLAAGALLCAQPAQAGPVPAGTIWYNGDYDGRDALVNQTGANAGRVYDDFILSSTTQLTGVFSDNFIRSNNFTTASWQIRSGVSSGNGGTLIASGDGAASRTFTGRSTNFGGFFVYNEFQVLVNIPTLTLGPGTYWLSVTPDTSDVSGAGTNSLLSTTSGANAIGTPPGNDGNSFITSSFYGYNYTAVSDPSVEGPGTWDFSMGVVAVPEPSGLGLAMAQIGTLGGFAVLRRRRRK